ncbi:phage tail assembly chaperone [Pseudomonas monteilii]|uniref:phage tail assembly chaperone n=1 Tax=Pseudomonas monteilii TaxID=76759 RepID=UPI00383AE560
MSGKYATFKADGTLALRLIKGLHDIPKGAVAIDDVLWKRLIDEQDGVWTMAEGKITKQPMPPPTPPSAEQLAQTERLWRDNAINQVRWIRERHRDEQDLGRATALDGEQFSEFLEYLQALRDWPQTAAFPDAAHRPVPPEWIADLPL